MTTTALVRTYDSAVEWFEMWGHKYDLLLRNTFLQTSHFRYRNKNLGQVFGYFDFYDGKIQPLPAHMLKRLAEVPDLWIVYCYDLPASYSAEACQALHEKAVNRLQRIEKRLNLAREAVLQAKSLIG